MAKIKNIKKRNGSIVDFSPEKIKVAIKKAFAAIKDGIEEEKLLLMTGAVVEELEKKFSDEKIPTVEEVQDLVEKKIMSEGYLDVAKAYIIYRYEHAKVREDVKKEELEKIYRNDLFVINNSGEKEKFDVEKLRGLLKKVSGGYEKIIDVEAIIQQCLIELHDNISTKDVSRLLISVTRSFIEYDPAYSKIAARLLSSSIYKEIAGKNIDIAKDEKIYKENFIKNIKKGIDSGRLDKKLLDFNLEELSGHLVPSRDDLFMYMGLQTLYDRYLLKNPYTKELLETPQYFWMRVAMGIATVEGDSKNKKAKDFYDMISLMRFTPSTPTLFHSGTAHPQLSSCYLNTVADSLDHIFKTYSDNAQLSKWSGGIGTDWTNVRATGALIKGTGVESQGIIAFLKIANDATVAINRSGRRRGAACVYLETWHHDIEDFLELRKNTGDERRRTHDMNTANWVPDLFMKRVRNDEEWTLFSPEEVPYLHDKYGKEFEDAYVSYEKMAKDGKIELTKIVKAKDLWKKMLSMLFETGHPWITFKDPSNIRSPQTHVGVVHNSNLCTEITLNTSQEETAVCNLGSINLPKHFKNGKLDEELIKESVFTAMRMLDNVIDVNFYPIEEARVSNLRHRPVGLGIMGFQDALYMLNIRFDSEEAVDFADKSMEMISYYAITASSLLAKEKGRYETYKGSKWDKGIFPVDTIALLEKERGEPIDVSKNSSMDWSAAKESVKKYGMRNSNCMAIAPTATISNITGSFPSIEPIYKNIYVKANAGGDFIIINQYLVEDLKKIGLWDYEIIGKIKYHDGSLGGIAEIPQEIKDKYKDVFEIDSYWLIKAAAYRGKWIDQSQSLNVFFKGTSGKELNDIYTYAWTMGLKTTYYLRTLGASQVEKSTVKTQEYGSTHLRDSGKITLSSALMSSDSENIINDDSAPKLCKIIDPTCEVCQ